MFQSNLDEDKTNTRMTRRSLLLSGTAVLGGIALWSRFGTMK